MPDMRSRRLACLLALAVTGCVSQEARHDVPPSDAERAARRAVEIEPGTPVDPAPGPEAVVLERLRERAAARSRISARLRLDTGADRHGDVWSRLRAGFGFEPVDHPSIDAALAWYVAHPDYIRRTTDRARPYLAYVAREAERRGLPLELALLPVVESAYQPYARSPAGAVGLWQFIRSTGRRYGLRQSAWYDARRDVTVSTRAAFDYLEKLHEEMNGDWLLAVASYNAGEGGVARAVARNRARGKPTDFFSLRLPAETRRYVPRLLAFSRLVADPHAHGITLGPIDDDPYFRRVDVGSQINLAQAAELAGVSLNELMLLNPGFMRHATDPDGPHRLLLPADAVPAFQEAFAELPPARRMPWTEHEVSSGETLSAIARRYGVSVESLRRANDVDGRALRVGEELRVPKGLDADDLASLSPEVRAGIERARRTAEQRVYRVRRGDSLWSISRAHRVRLGALLRWNGLSKRSVIRPGQRLVVWQGHAAAKSVATEPTSAVHVVRSGDSLWSIARRYRLSTKELARWNGIDERTTLRPGQELRLSPPRSATLTPRSPAAASRVG